MQCKEGRDQADPTTVYLLRHTYAHSLQKEAKNIHAIGVCFLPVDSGMATPNITDRNNAWLISGYSQVHRELYPCVSILSFILVLVV